MPKKPETGLTMARVLDAKPLPPPPAHLTAEQAEIWHSVVRTKPADWFSADNLPLLLSYCKHISQARLLDSAIDVYELRWLDTEEGVNRLDKLVGMRCKVSGKIESLATKMRLTQQSKYQPQRAASEARKTPAGAGRPWD